MVTFVILLSNGCLSSYFRCFDAVCSVLHFFAPKVFMWSNTLDVCLSVCQVYSIKTEQCMQQCDVWRCPVCCAVDRLPALTMFRLNHNQTWSHRTDKSVHLGIVKKALNHVTTSRISKKANISGSDKNQGVFALQFVVMLNALGESTHLGM